MNDELSSTPQVTSIQGRWPEQETGLLRGHICVRGCASLNWTVKLAGQLMCFLYHIVRKDKLPYTIVIFNETHCKLQ